MHWISVEPSPEDAGRLFDLNNTLYARVDDSSYEQETNPHITIVPGFNISEPSMSTIESLSHTPFSVTFEEYHIWPSMSNPMVVSLEPADESPLTRLREEAVNIIESNGEIQFDPKPFHLTLFKGGDAGDEDDFHAPNSSIQSIKEFTDDAEGLPLTIEFTETAIQDWEV